MTQVENKLVPIIQIRMTRKKTSSKISWMFLLLI
jgi:hypothetical protein